MTAVWVWVVAIAIGASLGAAFGHSIGEDRGYEHGYEDGYQQGMTQAFCADGPGTCCAVPADNPSEGCPEARP